MADSLQQVSQENMIRMMDDQHKQVKAGKKKPSFKKIIAEALDLRYKRRTIT